MFTYVSVGRLVSSGHHVASVTVARREKKPNNQEF